eukprot:12630345-Alexandrium_andersonii.AAC.1
MTSLKIQLGQGQCSGCGQSHREGVYCMSTSPPFEHRSLPGTKRGRKAPLLGQRRRTGTSEPEPRPPC